MLNPIEYFISFFWPKGVQLNKELTTRYRVVLYFNFLGILVLLYSIVKWGKLEFTPLVISAVVGIVIQSISTICVKFKISPILAANIALFGMYPHGMNMIFSLGGLSSAHIFWMPALVCIAYLLANRLSGMLWFFLAFGSVFVIIYAERSGIHISPYNFEFTADQKRLDTYSGFLLPMIMIWLAQNYAYKIRQESLDEALDAKKHTEKLAESSKESASRLSEILDEAKQTCSLLARSTSSLVENIKDMSENSVSIKNGAGSQVDASNEIIQTVSNTKNTLSETFQIVNNMESVTRQTVGNVTTTADSMTKTTQSMDKIKVSFSKIEDVIQVISGVKAST